MSRYDVFICYSQQNDAATAQAIQVALSRFGKPWYRRRALHVFRDSSSLPAAPALWSAIESILMECRYLVLLASPEAARSSWVERELMRWLESRGPEHILIAITAGQVSCAQAKEGEH